MGYFSTFFSFRFSFTVSARLVAGGAVHPVSAVRGALQFVGLRHLQGRLLLATGRWTTPGAPRDVKPFGPLDQDFVLRKEPLSGTSWWMLHLSKDGNGKTNELKTHDFFFFFDCFVSSYIFHPTFIFSFKHIFPTLALQPVFAVFFRRVGCWDAGCWSFDGGPDYGHRAPLAADLSFFGSPKKGIWNGSEICWVSENVHI